MFIDTYPSVRPPMQLNMQIIQDKIRVDHSSSAFWTEQNFRKKNKNKKKLYYHGGNP